MAPAVVRKSAHGAHDRRRAIRQMAIARSKLRTAGLYPLRAIASLMMESLWIADAGMMPCSMNTQITLARRKNPASLSRGPWLLESLAASRFEFGATDVGAEIGCTDSSIEWSPGGVSRTMG